jgi:hypothetical protein
MEKYLQKFRTWCDGHGVNPRWIAHLATHHHRIANDDHQPHARESISQGTNQHCKHADHSGGGAAFRKQYVAWARDQNMSEWTFISILGHDLDDAANIVKYDKECAPVRSTKLRRSRILLRRSRKVQ